MEHRKFVHLGYEVNVRHESLEESVHGSVYKKGFKYEFRFDVSTEEWLAFTHGGTWRFEDFTTMLDAVMLQISKDINKKAAARSLRVAAWEEAMTVADMTESTNTKEDES